MKGSRQAIIKLVESDEFINEFNSLLKPTNFEICNDDLWMPQGYGEYDESELKDFLKDNFSIELGEEIKKWWLSSLKGNPNTPNWDFISTCSTEGKRGIILLEAKAHADELNQENQGKSAPGSSIDSINNHEKIGSAINEAKEFIQEGFPEIEISRDRCYQLSNRIAHAWWLANQGFPIVLIYLGFLNCSDMEDGRRVLFESDKDWQECFESHATLVGAQNLINKKVNCGEGSFELICRSIDLKEI